MTHYELAYRDGWNDFFQKMDYSTQLIIWKKITQLHEPISARHLRFGSSHFVVEVGQYRICFAEQGNLRTIVFVGDHKQYEKWLEE